MYRIIDGRRFIAALIDAGVIGVEENVERLVIDVKADEIVHLYVERVGDERLLNVVGALTETAVKFDG